MHMMVLMNLTNREGREGTIPRVDLDVPTRSRSRSTACSAHRTR
jgi:hypothetical protein